jgi:hypothetical protein
VNNTANIVDQTVMVNLKYNSGELTIDKGSKVYVQEVEPDKIEITICKAPFIYSGTPSKNYLTLRCQYKK